MQGSVLRGGIFPAAMSACGWLLLSIPWSCAGMPWLPLALLLSKKPGLEEMMDLRSGHLLLHHPSLQFFSILNASLPHLGAGNQKERLQTSGWDL